MHRVGAGDNTGDNTGGGPLRLLPEQRNLPPRGVAVGEVREAAGRWPPGVRCRAGNASPGGVGRTDTALA